MNVETLSENKQHFEVHHENDEIIVCMQHNGQCAALVESNGLPEEQRTVERASKRAFARLDTMFGGRFAEVAKGLHIQIGDSLTESGGETVHGENKILFDRQKMLLSLADAEQFLPEVLDPGDWTSVMSPEEAAQPGSCLEYNITHEVGHILGQNEDDESSYHRVSSSESPTKYGRQPDKFSDKKDHEAFAEGFTYVAYDQPVSEAMQAAVDKLVQERLDLLEQRARH